MNSTTIRALFLCFQLASDRESLEGPRERVHLRPLAPARALAIALGRMGRRSEDVVLMRPLFTLFVLCDSLFIRTLNLVIIRKLLDSALIVCNE